MDVREGVGSVPGRELELKSLGWSKKKKICLLVQGHEKETHCLILDLGRGHDEDLAFTLSQIGSYWRVWIEERYGLTYMITKTLRLLCVGLDWGRGEQMKAGSPGGRQCGYQGGSRGKKWLDSAYIWRRNQWCLLVIRYRVGEKCEIKDDSKIWAILRGETNFKVWNNY